MKKKTKTVAARLIEELGGFRKTARELGMDTSALYRSREQCDDSKGNKGYIPPKYWPVVVKLSKKITLQDLMDEYSTVFPPPAV